MSGPPPGYEQVPVADRTDEPQARQEGSLRPGRGTRERKRRSKGASEIDDSRDAR